MKKKDLTQVKEADLRMQISNAQMQIATRRLKNTNAAKNLRKLLAQFLTHAKV